jgi:hypothetical protein
MPKTFKYKITDSEGNTEEIELNYPLKEYLKVSEELQEALRKRRE